MDSRGELGPAGRPLVEAPVTGKGVGHRPRVGVPGGVAPRVRVPVGVGRLTAGRQNLGGEVRAVCVLEVLVLLSVRREGVLLGVGDGRIDIGNFQPSRLRLRRGGGRRARVGPLAVRAGRRRRARAGLPAVRSGRGSRRSRLLLTGVDRRHARTGLASVGIGRRRGRARLRPSRVHLRAARHRIELLGEGDVLLGSRGNRAVQDAAGLDDRGDVLGLRRINELGKHLLRLGVVRGSRKGGGEIGDGEDFIRRHRRIRGHDLIREHIDVLRGGRLRKVGKLEVCADLCNGRRMGHFEARKSHRGVLVLRGRFERVFPPVDGKAVRVPRGLETRNRAGGGLPRDQIPLRSVGLLGSVRIALGSIRPSLGAAGRAFRVPRISRGGRGILAHTETDGLPCGGGGRTRSADVGDGGGHGDQRKERGDRGHMSNPAFHVDCLPFKGWW